MKEALGARRLLALSLASVARALALAGALLVLGAGLSISASRSDVVAETVFLGSDQATPALHLLPSATVAGAPGAAPLGTVVVVHGFAGTKEFMRDVSYTLARAGFEVYAVDLPGHGRSLLRLDPENLSPWFNDALTSLSAQGRLENGKVYLLGHSLGTLVATRSAMDNPSLGVRGVVALSPIFSAITPTQPANYMALYGESEMAGVKEAALEAVRAGTGLENPELEKVYGDYSLGTGRTARPIRDASHISIPDSRAAITETVEWFYGCAGVASGEVPRIESEKPERVAGIAGAIMLMFGLFILVAGGLGLLGNASRLPDSVAVVREARKAAGLPEVPVATTQKEPPNESVDQARARARQMVTITRIIVILWTVGAITAALVAGFAGALGFVGQAVSDYLVLYFLVFTLVTAPLVFLLGRPLQTGPLVRVRMRLRPLPAASLGLGLFVMAVALVGTFTTYAWTALIPPAWRLGQMLLLVGLFSPFVFFDEIVRSSAYDSTGSSWAFMVSLIGKLVMALTWFGALFLPHPPEALFMLLWPVALTLIALDVIAGLAYKEHGSWLASAVFKTLTLAWLAGSAFPLLRGPMAL